jgi:hypothetical protein
MEDTAEEIENESNLYQNRKKTLKQINQETLHNTLMVSAMDINIHCFFLVILFFNGRFCLQCVPFLFQANKK